MPGILLVCPAKRRKRYALINKSRMGTATLCNYLIAHIDSRGIETALLAFMASRSMLIRRSVCILPGSLPPSAFRLQGGYAIRWYEMCQAKKHLGTFTMSVEDCAPGWRSRSTHFHRSRICASARSTSPKPSWTRKLTSRSRTSRPRPGVGSLGGPSR